MRTIIIAAWATLSAATVAAAQSTSAQSTSAPALGQPGLALTACAFVGDTTVNRFTIARPRSAKSWYRSAGTLLLRSGQRVKVAGGLVPSPNIAAQAGSLDPAVPAMAMASGDAYRRPLGAARKPSVALATGPSRMRVDCAVR